MDNSRNNFWCELTKGIIIAIISALLSGFISNYFTKDSIVKGLTTRFEFVDSKMSYEEAIASVSEELEKSESEIKSLNEMINEQTAIIDEQTSAEEIDEIIQTATQYWNASDYQQCLTLLKNSKSRSSDIEALYSKYSDEYVLSLLSEVDSLISERKYEDAISVLEDGKMLVNDDKMIANKIEDIKSNNQPTKLSEIKITTSRFFMQADGKSLTDTVGNKYSSGDSYVIYAEGETDYGYATFYVGNKYTSLGGTIAVSDESEDRSDTQLQGWVEIGIKNDDDDFYSLWSSDMLSRTTSPIEIPELNIGDSEWLEIRYYNNGEYYSLADGYHSPQVIVSGMTLYVD